MRALGPDHVRTLQSMVGLAATLVNLGRYAEAQRLAADAGARAAATLGATHLDTVAAQGTRARALAGLGRVVDAESLLRRQLAILADKKTKGQDVGEGDALTHTLRVQLGMTLAALHRLPEAEAILLESVPQLPDRSADATRAVRFVVDFYERWNRAQPDPARAARAAEWRKRLTTPSPAPH